MADEISSAERLGGYRRVRVADDELVHYAAVDSERTIACEQVVVSEWVMVSDDRPGVVRVRSSGWSPPARSGR